MRTAYRTCPICDAVCGLRLTLDEDGRVASVRGDREDPFGRGYICPKGASLGRLDEDPDRLRNPLVRKDGEWREVGWKEAFAAVDEGLTRVVDAHGRRATAVYFGNPTFHTMAGILFRGPLAQALGTPNVFSASSIDQLPKQVACGLMLGDAMAIAVPDLDRTDYLLILGANPAESHGSLCAAPDFPGRLRALRERGGRLVVIDPRRTRTADLADEHLFIRPGSDAYLLLGIVHTLFAEDLATVDIEVEGLDELRRLVADFPPHAVAPACGIPGDVIVRLARELAAAPSAAVYTRVGTCTTEFGTVVQWLVDAINILTGNFDRPGGVMFTKPATAEPWRTGEPFTMGRWRSRVRGLPEALGELPLAALTEEIETPGEGQIRALVTVAGNPVLSAPNGARLDRALQGLEFMVCVDPYLNETTRHADVILPPPRILQMPHYDFLLLTVTVRNYARFSPAILPLEPGRPSEGEIMARLVQIAAGRGPDADPEALSEAMLDGMLTAAVTTPGSPFEGRDAKELRAELDGDCPEERILDAMLRLGPYGLSLAELRARPHGIDLGALRPRLAELLCIDRVRLAPRPLADDVVRLRERLDAPVADMVLIGRRQLRSNNSWLHNVPTLVGGSNRCTLQVNPVDVARLGLGDLARVRSAAGEVVVEVEPTDSIMPGVVSLPHGWGHEGTGQRVAVEHPGVNANALTDDAVVETVSGNAVFNGVPVVVEPVTEPGGVHDREGERERAGVR